MGIEIDRGRELFAELRRRVSVGIALPAYVIDREVGSYRSRRSRVEAGSDPAEYPRRSPWVFADLDARLPGYS